MTQRRTVYFLEYWTTSIGSISFDAFSCNSDYYTLYFRLTAVWSRHYNPISAADIGLSCRIQSLPSLQAFRLKLLQLQCLICRLFIKNCSIKQLLNSVFMNYQTSCRLLQPSALANSSAQLDIDNHVIDNARILKTVGSQCRRHYQVCDRPFAPAVWKVKIGK